MNGTTRGSHAIQFARAGLFQTGPLSGQVPAGADLGRFRILGAVPVAGRRFPDCRAPRDPRPAGRRERSPTAIQHALFGGSPRGIGHRRNPAGPVASHRRSPGFSRRRPDLRPAVLRQHDVPVLGPVLSRSPTAAFSWFRENIKCLTLLVLIGVAIASVRGLVPVAGENGQHGCRAGGGHPLEANASPADVAIGARRSDRSGGDAGHRPLHQGSRPGPGRNPIVDLSSGLRSVATCILVAPGAGRAVARWRCSA